MLNELRKEIDTIDEELLRLLNKRMVIVKKVGEYKNSSNAPIYRPEREKEIIDRLTKLSISQNGLLKREDIEAIFLEIFSTSRNLERTERVAFLGPIGTFTHQAAESRFGATGKYLPLLNIEAVFKSVSFIESKYGVVPIENNTEGIVSVTLDSLKKYDVKIVNEIFMDIHHSFASINEDISKIKRIYSHPQAYNQCKTFLEEHSLIKAEFIPTESTAKAALLAKEDKESGAICSHIAAKLYNLPLLFAKIEDNEANKTRFIVISDYKTQKSGNDKTCLLYTSPSPRD
jgi:chorismate mutase/prephenate dehydratase